MDDTEERELIDLYRAEQYKFQIFLNSVYDFFRLSPQLNESPMPLIHSLKSRLKDTDHLIDKIRRKSTTEDPITRDNFFDRITDLAGVRVLHLYQQQFASIHQFLQQKIIDGDWVLFEPPCAYTWDPESEAFFSDLGIQCKIKDTYYTSVHYVVMPKANSPIKCEIQIRTLYEEIWGEIDHYINYPLPTTSIACKEQLRVLSKLSVTGTRLADSILNSHDEFLKHSEIIQELQSSAKHEDALVVV